jgi:hypothetical protein
MAAVRISQAGGGMQSADRGLETRALDYAAAHTIRVDVLPKYTVSHIIFTALEITDITGIFERNSSLGACEQISR